MYAILWYDRDGSKDGYSGKFDSVEAAAKAAGNSTLEHGIDLVFDVVDFQTHRVVQGWRKQVPDLESF